MSASHQAAMALHAAPLLPVGVIIALAAITVIAALLPLLHGRRRGVLLRLAACAIFLATLINPSLLQEDRKPVPDVAVLLIDQSASQSFGDRTRRTEAAAEALKAQLESRKDLDVRIVSAGQASAGAPARDTRLYAALDDAFSDVPARRRAGAILLTDGLVHDLPARLPQDARTRFGPVHVLLSGDRDEHDRRLVLLKAPAYGIVGQTVTLSFRIEDSPETKNQTATVRLTLPDGTETELAAPVGVPQNISVTIANPGENVVALETDGLPNELTPANNRAALVIRGVRDRMKVLLVSGEPYAGGRTWRDILKSDPGVDLVHFTILREPTKLDLTPQNEMSLIAFPVQELFEDKLYDFDLIIFDRYRLNQILPSFYFSNLAAYVNNGGAFLESSGPTFADDKDSLFHTAMGDVFPAVPDGDVLHQPFRPKVTDLGARHPVTENLAPEGAAEWGRWLEQIAVTPRRGDVLMSGAGDKPLLILDRVGKGRVAQLASSQIWLWSRGYEGGGPHAELLRRLAHWLMKEPELEEDALDVRVEGSEILVRRRRIHGTGAPVILTRPDGRREELTFDAASERRIKASQLGIYRFEDGDNIRHAIVGDINPPELSRVVTDEAPLKPLVTATGGVTRWLVDASPAPTVRLVADGSSMSGRGWIGLRRGGDYAVTGVRDVALMPASLGLALILSLMLLAWWREGRGTKSSP